MSIKSVFDKYAEEYDEARRKLIPCFDDFYKITVEIIPFEKMEKIRVLDLGAGTGLLSEMIISSYPMSEVTLIDVSSKMLQVAKNRLKKFFNKIDYIEENYSQGSLPDEYDLIISSLSIHHLNDRNKKILFGNCFRSLATGGTFINADQVLGETPYIENLYKKKWLEKVKNNGVSKKELEAAFERMKEDRMSTLDYQLSCLKEVGFSDTTCWYKNYSFVVFGGTKK